MVALGISEFTFGFAFLSEQTRKNWGNLRVAPILQSLWGENERGWDAHLPVRGTDFFYQFKLSDYLVRSNAKYRRDGTFRFPYFRISLHKYDQNKQHRLLKELSRKNPETYYVAPETDSLDIFNRAFLAGNIIDHSRMIPIRDCNEINDGEQHLITFQLGDPAWIQHSESSRHEKSLSGKNLAEFYRGTADKWHPVNDEFANSLFNRVANKVFEIREGQRQLFERPVEELLDFEPQAYTRAETIDQAAKILSVFFGVSLVIAGESG